MVGFVAVMVAVQVVSTASRSSRNAYRFDVFPREQRVTSSAYFRAARNVGYTLGALLAGVALATNSDDVIRLVPAATAALLLLNAALVSRLPTTVPGSESESPLEAAMHGEGRRSALRNRGFLLMSICGGVLGTHQVLLNVVIPLWLVSETDAPRVLLAWLFGTNTVLAVLLQVAAARGVVTVADSLRAIRRGAVFFVLSCGIVLVTHDTIGWVTIALVWVGHVTVTGAELFDSAGEWGLQAELSDPARRGEYQGVSQLGYTLGSVWAPAAYTFLAMEWGTPGWLIIAAIVVVAAIAIHPSARAAERQLARETAPVATISVTSAVSPEAAVRRGAGPARRARARRPARPERPWPRWPCGCRSCRGACRSRSRRASLVAATMDRPRSVRRTCRARWSPGTGTRSA